MANPRTGKFLPKCLFQISSDQNMFVCLSLFVHLKIFDSTLPWIWHGACSSHHWKCSSDVLLAHIFPILHHISKYILNKKGTFLAQIYETCPVFKTSPKSTEISFAFKKWYKNILVSSTFWKIWTVTHCRLITVEVSIESQTLYYSTFKGFIPSLFLAFSTAIQLAWILREAASQSAPAELSL